MKRLAAFVLLTLIGGFCPTAQAASADDFQSGIALHGSTKYGDLFAHFDYADPDAPKGGDLRLAVAGTFDNLNPFILKGIAAAGAGLVYETLMESSLDEPFSQYGWIAEGVKVAPDRSWVQYKIRKEARFQDGKPITADDVIFSFETLREKGHPYYRSYYKDVAKAEKISAHEVRFVFSTTGNTELPLIMGQLPVIPKHYWQDKDFAATTLIAPLGSGPYRINEAAPGRQIILSRVKDWWAKDLPINRGRYNFDTIRYDYYRDQTILLEGLLAGRYDFRQENIAKNWATGYETPAVKKGDIIKNEIKNELPSGMQGFILNTRREVFKDKKVREALTYAFDFEWGNKNVAYESYARSESYFSNSELAATEIPTSGELALLEPFRDQLPAELFTTPFKLPVTDGSGDNRANLLKASELLRDAGWMPRNGKLVNSKGQALSFEILVDSPMFERWIQPYRKNLERLGIETKYRIVDSAQYQSLIDSFDYDMITGVFGQSLNPGNEQRDYWGSQNADKPGSKNLIGIKSPVVDALVDKIIHATDRAQLVTACRALDRVLLWGHYVVPHWHAESWRLAYWDIFGHPSNMPKYGLGFPENWWLDNAKAEKIAPQMKRNR